MMPQASASWAFAVGPSVLTLRRLQLFPVVQGRGRLATLPRRPARAGRGQARPGADAEMGVRHPAPIQQQSTQPCVRHGNQQRTGQCLGHVPPAPRRAPAGGTSGRGRPQSAQPVGQRERQPDLPEHPCRDSILRSGRDHEQRRALGASRQSRRSPFKKSDDEIYCSGNNVTGDQKGASIRGSGGLLDGRFPMAAAVDVCKNDK
jgi:hypothetical protein